MKNNSEKPVLQDQLRILHQIPEPIIICEAIRDQKKNIVDLKIIDYNQYWKQNFQDQINIEKNCSIKEIYQKIDTDWLSQFLPVLEDYRQVSFEYKAQTVANWFELKAFPINKNQFGIITHNITKFKQTEVELNSLLKASRAILEYKKFEDSAKIIFEICKELTGATAGYVALLSENGDENEVLFLDAGGDPCTVDPELPMPIRGLRAESYKSGTAVFDNNFANSHWMKYMPQGHVYLKNVMFAPLIIDQIPVGLIGLANKPDDFNNQDAKIASILGEIASIALKNSHTLDLLNQSRKELKQEIITKNKFFSIISHDLKNQLSGLRDLTELYYQNPNSFPKDKILDTFKIVSDGTQKLYSFLSNLIEWAKTQKKSIHVNKTQINLADKIKYIITLFEYKLNQKKIQIQADILPNLSCNSDKAILETILRNLISNAIKYSYQGGTISIEITQKDQQTIFSISDQGIGMNPKEVEQLFILEEKNSNPGTDGEEGTGLGLALCKEFIELLNGTIWVDSAPQKGTTFYFSIPTEDTGK